jgi:hypothetical protein
MAYCAIKTATFRKLSHMLMIRFNLFLALLTLGISLPTLVHALTPITKTISIIGQLKIPLNRWSCTSDQCQGVLNPDIPPFECSAFFISDSKIVTAAHCLDAKNCSDILWTNDQSLSQKGQKEKTSDSFATYQLSKKHIISCKKILYEDRHVDDMAVIEVSYYQQNNSSQVSHEQLHIRALSLGLSYLSYALENFYRGGITPEVATSSFTAGHALENSSGTLVEVQNDQIISLWKKNKNTLPGPGASGSPIILTNGKGEQDDVVIGMITRGPRTYPEDTEVKISGLLLTQIKIKLLGL